MWALDADMNRIFWEKHFDKPQDTAKDSGANAAACASAVAALPSLMPPPAFGRGGPPRPAAKGATASLLAAGGFGGPRPAFAISSDGKLHLINTSTGEDVTPGDAVPSGRIESNKPGCLRQRCLHHHDCRLRRNPAGVWALDLSGEGFKVTNFTDKAAAVHGIAISADGRIFAQTADSVTALKPKELLATDSFKAPAGMANAAPVIFNWKEREFIVAAGKAGQLYVFDSKSLATPLSETAVAGSIWGGLSSWQDAGGTRWILAPVWGSGHGKIAAYRLDDSGGAPTLTQAWVSGELPSPEPPVITSGIVFALSAGNYANEHAKPSGHAKLFAFDGTTGKELYNTGDQVTSPANLTGVTVANGRVFFTATDGTLYGFGIFLER